MGRWVVSVIFVKAKTQFVCLKLICKLQSHGYGGRVSWIVTSRYLKQQLQVFDRPRHWPYNPDQRIRSTTPRIIAAGGELANCGLESADAGEGRWPADRTSTV